MFGIVFIFISIFIFIVVFAYYLSTKKQNSFHGMFTSKLALLAQIFIPIGIFLTYQVFTLQHEAMAREATFNIIDRAWLGINEKLIIEYDKCPNFINSLYFDWQIRELGHMDNKQKNNEWYAVNYLSILIFQAWEDFITATSADETGMYVWMNNFLQWSNSKILKNNWRVLKGNFADTTQDFGDFLFDLSMSRNPKILLNYIIYQKKQK